jgi:hypothetical protein
MYPNILCVGLDVDGEHPLEALPVSKRLSAMTAVGCEPLLAISQDFVPLSIV